MNDGWVKLWRCSMDSRVWKNPGLWQVWCWCLLKANHKDKKWESVSTGRGTTEVLVKRGQFVFGRHKASEELLMPGRTVYDRMKKLEKVGNIVIQSNRHFSLVTILNYEKYQEAPVAGQQPTNNQNCSNLTETPKNIENPANQSANQKGNTTISNHTVFCNDNIVAQQPTQQPTNNQPTTNQHKQECKECKEEIKNLSARYDPELLKLTIEHITLTRKTGKIADTIILKQLKRWDKLPKEQVERGMEIYTSQEYFLEGKNENYLWGIIRNSSALHAPKKKGEKAGKVIEFGGHIF